MGGKGIDEVGLERGLDGDAGVVDGDTDAVDVSHGWFWRGNVSEEFDCMPSAVAGIVCGERRKKKKSRKRRGGGDFICTVRTDRLMGERRELSTGSALPTSFS